jgi:dihydroorotate dehydrogenase (NAD+) catalytic subunit
LVIANTYIGMSIDVRTRRSKLGKLTGGLSGPAIKPLTLRLVYEASGAVKVPVIGLGGIESGTDVLEYLIAGAKAVQVGTANFAQPDACVRILDELCKACLINNITNFNELYGFIRDESA